jgi:hypothetical protein
MPLCAANSRRRLGVVSVTRFVPLSSFTLNSCRVIACTATA